MPPDPHTLFASSVHSKHVSNHSLNSNLDWYLLSVISSLITSNYKCLTPPHWASGCKHVIACSPSVLNFVALLSSHLLSPPVRSTAMLHLLLHAFITFFYVTNLVSLEMGTRKKQRTVTKLACNPSEISWQSRSGAGKLSSFILSFLLEFASVFHRVIYREDITDPKDHASLPCDCFTETKLNGTISTWMLWLSFPFFLLLLIFLHFSSISSFLIKCGWKLDYKV